VLRFNSLLDAAVAAGFLVLVGIIVLLSVWEWVLLLGRRKLAVLHETDPVWLPDYAVVEGRGAVHVVGIASLALGLAKELSGEAEMERTRQLAAICECRHCRESVSVDQQAIGASHSDLQLYLEVAERRFKGVKRCC
jgi:hypothetical protein